MRQCLLSALLLLHLQAWAGEHCIRPSCTAPTESFSARVIAVIDGDTLLILRHQKPLKVRLADIDAPEKGQDFGQLARRSLADMVLGKQVEFESRATDRYGRLVAMITADGLDVNAEQVRRGMAWQDAWRSHNSRYEALQTAAREAHLGLWLQPHPVRPSEWRKTHPLRPHD